jgi:hypothetical protein
MVSDSMVAEKRPHMASTRRFIASIRRAPTRVVRQSTFRKCVTLGLSDAKWDIQTAALLVAVLSIIVTVYIARVQNHMARVQNDVQGDLRSVQHGVRQLAMGTAFSIVTPQKNASVGETEPVSGMTPFGDRHHYLVVTPSGNDIPWIPDLPIDVDAGGNWSGMAKFGEGKVGIGQHYTIRCLATMQSLPSGRLHHVPADAFFSDDITVVRTH